MSLIKLLFLTKLNFSMVESTKKLFRCVTFCRLIMTTDTFLVSGEGQNVMTNNSLSINVESKNIFYQNFNTNENFQSFLTAQQDETKAIIPKRISYHYSFEKYINKYLPSFSINNAEKFDIFANKNSKYLFYKLNRQIKALGGEKQTIRHTSKMKDSISLKK